jgi:hypothetical protein
MTQNDSKPMLEKVKKANTHPKTYTLSWVLLLARSDMGRRPNFSL